jgi:SMC interacting uncharacterized protein involved in chromosome segregation
MTTKQMLTMILFALGVGLIGGFFLTRKTVVPPLVTQSQEYQESNRVIEELRKEAVATSEKVKALEDTSTTLEGQVTTLKAKLAKEQAKIHPVTPANPPEELLIEIAYRDSVIELQTEVISKQDEVVKIKDIEIITFKSMLGIKDKIINEQDNQIIMFQEQESKLVKQMKSERWKGRREGFVTGVSCGILGGKLL